MIRHIRAFIERIRLDSGYRKKIRDLEKLTGIPIYRPRLYLKALRHRSILAENRMMPTDSYEQLEFIGDAVLDLVASEIIFHHYPDADEGFMTQLRSRMVKGEMLAILARKIQLMHFLELGERVKNQGVEESDSVLADSFEALVGAVFQDHGYGKTREFVMGLYERYVVLEELVTTRDNYKSILLEKVQANKKGAPVYNIVKETGPGHLKSFVVEVVVDDTVLGTGTGKNKKKAEQAAAQAALRSFLSK